MAMAGMHSFRQGLLAAGLGHQPGADAMPPLSLGLASPEVSLGLPKFKVVLVGDQSVGKTALAVCRSQVLGMRFSTKTMQLLNGSQIRCSPGIPQRRPESKRRSTARVFRVQFWDLLESDVIKNHQTLSAI
ncbi:unnamed protein product [Effrenium voratum]|nr:unnamed protein product [Effrenium voratum]